MHYKREARQQVRLASTICAVTICTEDAIKGGYCGKHLYRCLDVVIEENWLPVVGWERLYEVSDLGRVRSVERWIVHEDGRRVWYPSVHVGLRPGRQGYLQALLCRNSSSKTINVHRLVLEAFVGLRPAGLCACHGNGDPHDNSLVNLRWDTYSENSLDTVRHGTNWKLKNTRCPRGHRLLLPNLVMSALRRQRTRTCLACAKAKQQLCTTKYVIESGVDLVTLADEHYVDILTKARIAGNLPAELEGEC